MLCYTHIEASQFIYNANQSTGFYMGVMALYPVPLTLSQKSKMGG